uniref:Uncharacterized protein n=1 Tax=Anguilla anguilla TaxID=7936 RepID=A0A0E9SJI2_ANGAN
MGMYGSRSGHTSCQYCQLHSCTSCVQHLYSSVTFCQSSLNVCPGARKRHALYTFSSL